MPPVLYDTWVLSNRLLVESHHTHAQPTSKQQHNGGQYGPNRTCWLMLLVRPLSISCLCLNTAIRAEPRPLSSRGRPELPCVSTATRVDLPLSMLPATAGGRVRRKSWREGEGVGVGRKEGLVGASWRGMVGDA